MKAVIARILGFAGAAEFFACARTIPQLKIKASNVTAAKQRRNRIETRESGRIGLCSCKYARRGERPISIQDSACMEMDWMKSARRICFSALLVSKQMRRCR